MNIVEIKSMDNGSHRNQTITGTMFVPEGFAVVPDDMVLENFPFGEITASEIDGVMTVTEWKAGTIPESEPEQEIVPSVQDDIEAMLIEHEYRLTLLELNITEEV